MNTSDSRVELTWCVASSGALSDEDRGRILAQLERRIVAGAITVSAAEQRSQLRNRELACEKLADLVRVALAPEGPERKATKPTRGSKRRRLETKGRRSELKKSRRRPLFD